MEIKIENSREEILYIVSNFPKEYEEILKNQFYKLENGNYVKKFSNKTQNIQRISENFTLYAEEMFNQMGYFTEVKWKEALLGFIKKIYGHDINWWLTGSCALAVRGVATIPHDVDIMLDSKDINKINDLFLEYLVEPIESTEGWVVRYFGVLFLNARIDVAFDPENYVDQPYPTDFGPNAQKNLEKIDFEGYTIKVPPLQLQLDVNKRRGRIERVKAIDDYLNHY